MNTKRTEFSFAPQLIINEGNTTLINANIKEELRESGFEDTTLITIWTADSVRVELPLSYAKIVSAFVRLHYSADEVEAILLNKDDGNVEHLNEYNELQEWRKLAKEIAHLVINK